MKTDPQEIEVGSTPGRTTSGLTLAVARMLDVNPYRAPHANRGTPARRHLDRTQQRLRLKAVALGGHILNMERGIQAKYLHSSRAAAPANDNVALAEAA
jgi:hypothetical protein